MLFIMLSRKSVSESLKKDIKLLLPTPLGPINILIDRMEIFPESRIDLKFFILTLSIGIIILYYFRHHSFYYSIQNFTFLFPLIALLL